MHHDGSQGTLVPVVVLVLYCTTSIVAVFLNRVLFAAKHYDAPLLVTWLQQVLTLLALEAESLYKAIKRFLRLPQKGSASCSVRPTVLTWKILRRSFLPALAFVGMIASNAYCLKFSSVASYQVARSSTIFFNLLFSWWFLRSEHLTWHSVFSCMLIASGILIGALDPKTLSWKICLTGGLGSLFQALHSTGIKFLFNQRRLCRASLTSQSGTQKSENLPQANDSVIHQKELLYVNSLISIISFLPLLWATGQYRDIGFLFGLTTRDPDVQVLRRSIYLSSASGALVTFTAFLCLQRTSPLSYNVAGYTKAALQSLGSIVFLQEGFSSLSLLSIFITLTGCFYFCLSRHYCDFSKPHRSMSNHPTEPPFFVVQSQKKELVYAAAGHKKKAE